MIYDMDMMKTLHQRLLEGEAKALRRFYQETQPKLVAWMRKRVGIEADLEELVQDTYLAFIDSLPLYRGTSNLWTFLVSIAKHEVADYWRKKYAKKVIATVPFIDQVYQEHLYSAAETACAVEVVMERLLPEERVVLVWKYEEHLTVKEIAERLRVGVKAAESRIYRARKAFQLAYMAMYEE
jgi:RNA polymerase sigma-70 factor, ECF subfamily